MVDLRDPWFGGTHRRYFSALWGAHLYFRWIHQLEAKIMRYAARILVNTKQVQDDLTSRFPEAREKVFVLPNGYDESDFQGIVPQKPQQGGLTFLHSGEIYPQYRDPRPLLEAFEDLIREGTIQSDNVKVRFVGGGDWIASAEFWASLEGKAVQGIITIEPPVTHREAVSQMLSADVLLLLQASPLANGQIPAKVFEYLRAGRPILSVTPSDSASAEMAALARNQWRVDASKPTDLRDALRDIVARHRAGELQASYPAGEKFERREMARSLRGVLCACLPETSAMRERESCGLSR